MFNKNTTIYDKFKYYFGVTLFKFMSTALMLPCVYFNTFEFVKFLKTYYGYDPENNDLYEFLKVKFGEDALRLVINIFKNYTINKEVSL